MMKLGIDATNIRSGGGLTHLVQLLTAAQPEKHGFDKVVVWGSQSTLNALPEKEWLILGYDKLLEAGLFQRKIWQLFKLPNLLRLGCDVLFVPGGIYSGSFRPFAAMAQNALPFENNERKRYGLSWQRLRLEILRVLQSRTFSKASGIQFLTKSAKKIILTNCGKINGEITVIPHGIDPSFFKLPRKQFLPDNYSDNNLFRVLYVSIIDVYKHQWHVVEAVDKLYREGVPISLQLVGPGYPPALERLQKQLSKSHGTEYLGSVEYEKLAMLYHEADLFVFASSCETISIILMEAMAAGLPIASSSREVMSEMLQDAGVYFDPEKPEEIAAGIQKLFVNRDLRAECAQKAYNIARQYTWAQCANETFSFLANIANKHK